VTNVEPVRWGVLGAANIAVNKVIPAIDKSRIARTVAIASRDLAKARAAAARLGIPNAYGSYEELIDDPDVEAIYNPLPNHLHVPWSIRAAQRGKHVLCEKPIALTADEARLLLAARDANRVQIAEAFMVRTHPQWLEVEQILASGRVGELQVVSSLQLRASRRGRHSEPPRMGWRCADGHRVLSHLHRTMDVPRGASGRGRDDRS
jgi:predicted dehydrogenase